MRKKIYCYEIECPACGFALQAEPDDDKDDKEVWETNEEAAEVNGDDPDNVGAETNKQIHPADFMNNQVNKLQELTKNLVTAAKLAKAKDEQPVKATKKLTSEDASDILAKAIKAAREKR